MNSLRRNQRGGGVAKGRQTRTKTGRVATRVTTYQAGDDDLDRKWQEMSVPSSFFIIQIVQKGLLLFVSFSIDYPNGILYRVKQHRTHFRTCFPTRFGLSHEISLKKHRNSIVLIYIFHSNCFINQTKYSRRPKNDKTLLKYNKRIKI